MVTCIAIPLLSHIVFATTEAFVTSWDEPFNSLLLSVRVQCYMSSGNNSFFLTIIFKYVAENVILQCWKQLIIAQLIILLL